MTQSLLERLEASAFDENSTRAPYQRLINPDGPEAAALIREYDAALERLLAEFAKFSRYGSPIAHAANEAVNQATALRAKASRT
jgi:hypothetical protein